MLNNTLFSKVYTKIYPEYGFIPKTVDVNDTLSGVGIQMYMGYNKTLVNHHTDGSPLYFPKDKIPHVFF